MAKIHIATDITEQKKVNDELVESKNMLNTVLDNIPMQVLWKDTQSAYLGCNRNAAKMVGLNSPEEIVGKRDADLVSTDEENAFFLEMDRKVISSGQPEYNIVEPLTRPDGSQGWINTNKIPLTDANGKVKGILVAYQDITQKLEDEKKLRESERKFRMISENSSDGLIVFSHEHKPTYYSPSFIRLFGFETESELPLSVEDIEKRIHPDDAQPLLTKILKSIENKEDGLTYTFRSLHKNGHYFWREDKANFMYDEKGNYNGSYVVCRDITNRKQAEEKLKDSKNRVNALLKAIPDMMFVFDKQNRFIDFNTSPFFAPLLPSDTFMHKTIQEVLPAHIVTKHLKAREALEKTGQPQIYRYDITANNDIQYYESRMVQHSTDTVLAIVRNITHEEKNIKLEQEIILARKEAAFKQTFLATMSHEIRTPLTGIIGMAEHLWNTPLDTQQQDAINTIVESGENLKSIINLVLDYSKLQAGQMQVHPSVFQLRRLIVNAENLFATICNKSVHISHHIAPELPEYIVADRPKVTQVLSNFLSNAAKFTCKGEVKITIAPENDAAEVVQTDEEFMIKVGVEDTGTGVDKENLKYLFTPFYQVPLHHKTQSKGTGLGLSISKQLSLLMGGNIGVESQVGKGSCFWFTFKAKRSAQTTSVTQKDDRFHVPNKKSLNILVVEDNKLNRKVFGVTLGFMGHTVTFAHNGKVALDLFKPGVYDLILMDIQMPVMDGITTTRQLKNTYKQLPPIVGLSANAFEGDREKYIQQGLDEYLTKPLQKEKFQKVLQKLML